MHEVCNKQERGRPKKTWWETFKHDMGYNGFTEDMAIDRDD